MNNQLAYSIWLSLLITIYLWWVFRRDLQMLQQNSYRNNRYLKWLRQSGDTTSVKRLILVAVVFMLLAFPYGWAYGGASGIVIVLAASSVGTKSKKPLVMTKRAWRLFLGMWLITIALISATVFTLPTLLPYVLFAVAYFSFAILMGVNYALVPVEKAINQNYIDDAKKRLSQMDGMIVVGITGSYGKTSTKHYLNRILSEKYSVLMTPGSYNTPMGVVRTIREMMQPYNNLFICEMGAKNIGDIKEICDIVHPTVGVVTAVGPQHLESFKTIENVQRTKFELVDCLLENGFAVVNNDFEYIANRKVTNVECYRYAIDNTPGSQYVARNISYTSSGTSFEICGPDGFTMQLTTKLVGACNISNLMAAVIVALKLNVPCQKIVYAVSKIEQVEHRLNMKRTLGGVTIIDDAFNSNPDGSRMALDVIGGMTGGKRIVVTPGMIELGDKQEEYNRNFGRQMAKCCDCAIVVGRYNRDAIVGGLQEGGMEDDAIIIVDSFNEAQEHLQHILCQGDIVLYENDLPDTFK